MFLKKFVVRALALYKMTCPDGEEVRNVGSTVMVIRPKFGLKGSDFWLHIYA